MQEGECFLHVKHLPLEFNGAETITFLKYFGATDNTTVSFIDNRRKFRSAVAAFPSNELARSALLRLHQLRILGRTLQALYLPKDRALKLLHKQKPTEQSDSGFCLAFTDVQETPLSEICEKSGEPVLSNPFLRYEYPLANISILKNISVALAACPTFYNQVLHLMNKMNLPCPLGTSFPGSQDILGLLKELEQKNDGSEPSIRVEEDMEVSECESLLEEESEMEDELSNEIPRATLPKAMTRKKSKVLKTDPMAISRFFGKTARERPKKHQEIFDFPKKLASAFRGIEKREPIVLPLQLKVSGERLGVTSDVDRHEGNSQVVSPKLSNLENEDILSVPAFACATMQEIDSLRLPLKEQLELPLFNNLVFGEKTNRLYVKNIAKHVSEEELQWLFGSFVRWEDRNNADSFFVRLMKSGRMKGQAFITFHDAITAEKALSACNAVLLKGKPLAIVFSKTSVQNNT